MTFLSRLLFDVRSSSDSFYLIQSSTAQSSLPLLREIIKNARPKCTVILLCTIYAPLDLLDGTSSDGLRIIDWTEAVPGYGSEPMSWESRLRDVQNTAKASTRPVAVVVDSVDALEVDISFPSEAYSFIRKVLSHIKSLQNNSKLVCHITSFSSLMPLLEQSRLSSSLIHLTAHPTALITHITHAYLTSPPPSGSSVHSASPDELKFWRAFVPLANRPLDIESLVFGTEEHAEGGGSPDEFVVDIVLRGRGADLPNVPIAGTGKRRNVERFLEGWSVSKSAPVPLEELDSLRSTWRKKSIVEREAPDPAKDLTFNLNLTDSQQVSRSQVLLPYERSGRSHVGQNQGAHIFYDPDSADDLDEEDPDEDLDL